MSDDRVLVDQPGPHGRRGECRTADVHGAAVVGLEPGDLGDRVAGDQAGVPVDRADRRGEHHLRHVPPAAGGGAGRGGGGGGRGGGPGGGRRSASGSSSSPTVCARTAPGPSPPPGRTTNWNSSSLGTLQPRSSPGAA